MAAFKPGISDFFEWACFEGDLRQDTLVDIKKNLTELGSCI